MNIKKSLKKEWPFLAFFLLNILAAILVYPKLPATIPSHWNMNGEIDGYSPRNFIFIMSAMPLAIYLLMTILPSIDPKRRNYDKFKGYYTIFKIILGLLFTAINGITIIAALGKEVNVSLLVNLVLGVFFAAIGNYMSTVKQNYFMGIKTPWTLASEKNWDKTHNLAGKLWVIAGILVIIISLTGHYFINLPIILAAAFIPVIYSFILFKKGI